jgi:hypothetical protein
MRSIWLLDLLLGGTERTDIRFSPLLFGPIFITADRTVAEGVSGPYWHTARRSPGVRRRRARPAETSVRRRNL